MSDDDNRRGPRGPRKPGGGGGRDKGGRDGGGFKGGGFKAGPRGPGGFKDTGARGEFRSEFRGEGRAAPRGEGRAAPRGESYRPSGFRPVGAQDASGFRDAPGAAERPPRERREDGERQPRRAREDRPGRAASERPRSSSRPERRPFLPREGRPERLASPEKEGGVERIAKVIARAGVASRREAEEMIEQGRVTVNGERIASPALDVAPDARITVDGEALPARERTRLWLYHKPSGLVSTNHDPEGRTTLFETLPEDLPRVITVGRLDINTEGLLLLTNDGGLARVIGHPETGWLRRYRVRAYGEITQDKLDAVRGGVTIDGENFGAVIATRDRQVGDNTWLTVDLREGKNREVKRVLEHLGLVVNRLIRISFGPFQLGDLAEGEVEEVRTRVLRDQLGDQLASIAGVDFDAPVRNENRLDRPHPHEEPRQDARGGRGRPAAAGREERGPRQRFDRERTPEGRTPEKPARPRREGAYHRAREEGGDAPRDILLRAEEGRGAIWRDEETTGLKPRRTGPRRGADPREERSERAARDAAGGRERVRARPIEDPKGRRITVERVSGPSPDLPRKPRYTRADFAAPSGEERPFRRPRTEEGGEDRRPARAPRGDFAPRGDGPGRAPRGDVQSRPPRANPEGRSPRANPEGRSPRGNFEGRPPRTNPAGRPPRGPSDRPERAGGDRPLKPRYDGGARGAGEGFKPRGPRQDFGDRPPRKSFDDRAPRKAFEDRAPRKAFEDRAPRKAFEDRAPRSGEERSFRPRPDGDRPQRGFREGGRKEGGGFGAKPFGKDGASRGGPGRSGPARSPGRGGDDKPRGPRKPRS